MMLQTPSSSPKSEPLAIILQTVPRLSHAELLELIAYLAQQAQQTAVRQTTYSWHDIAGIAPNLLAGQDAQEWVNQTRQEWDRVHP
ncbi:MAG: hypothetical protein M5U34_25895 [Chloroflexi bacterium]|nr:hypothetical protein [Chloroflexota bacterium]